MTLTEGDQQVGWPEAGPEGSSPSEDKRFTAMAVSAVLTLILGIGLFTLPVPYVVETPGPTYNTLGVDKAGNPVISIKGRETFPANGNLYLTTVYVEGGPKGYVSVLSAFAAWVDESKAVYPVEMIYPEGITREESDQEGAAAMTTSQEDAVAAALNELDVPFDQKLKIADVPDSSPSQGKLERGDVFVSVGGKPVTALNVVQEELAAGAGKPVPVVVDRNGTSVTETITPAKNASGRYILGVQLEYDFTFPVEVNISLQEVVGPSAGMVFALGIVDTMTPGDLTGGRKIAGTGTISPDGSVGPIGGIGQKMVGAQRSGATVFLAPAANCEQVLGHIPDGLQVVKIENLAQAKKAVELVGAGQDTAALPTCTTD
ncbi:YlbL family protein [Arthrobacter sp. R4-81]